MLTEKTHKVPRQRLKIEDFAHSEWLPPRDAARLIGFANDDVLYKLRKESLRIGRRVGPPWGEFSMPDDGRRMVVYKRSSLLEWAEQCIICPVDEQDGAA